MFSPNANTPSKNKKVKGAKATPRAGKFSRGDRRRGSEAIRKPYLLAGISAAGDDGNTADLEELHLSLAVRFFGEEGGVSMKLCFVVVEPQSFNLVQNSAGGLWACKIGARVLCGVT